MRALGLGQFTFLEHDPAALVRLARAAGFGFIGPRFHAFAPGEVEYLPKTPAALRDIRAAMDGEGVVIYDVEAISITPTLDVEGVKPVAEAAAELGAERLNCSADDWDHPALVETFAAVAEIAQDAGLGVDLECMAFRGIDTPKKCHEVIDASGAANAGYLCDSLHHYRCGGDAGSLAAMDPARVRSVQLCDAPARRPETREGLMAEARGGRLIPGEGALDLKNLIAALPDHATLSVEMPMANDARDSETRARDIFRATMTLIENAT